MVDFELYEKTSTGLAVVTDCNLFNAHGSNLDYFMYDVRRPISGLQHCSFKRYFTFKITGDYVRIKGIRIELPKGLSTTDNWTVGYKLTNEYSQPESEYDEFGKITGKYDGSLTILNEDTTVYPKLSTTSPEDATTRERSYSNGATLWTEYLVLQFNLHPGESQDNFGIETVTLKLEEMET